MLKLIGGATTPIISLIHQATEIPKVLTTIIADYVNISTPLEAICNCENLDEHFAAIIWRFRQYLMSDSFQLGASYFRTTGYLPLLDDTHVRIRLLGLDRMLTVSQTDLITEFYDFCNNASEKAWKDWNDSKSSKPITHQLQ